MKFITVITAAASILAVVNGAAVVSREGNQTAPQIDSLLGTWYTVGVEKDVIEALQKKSNATCDCQQITVEKGNQTNQLNLKASCMLKLNPDNQGTNVSSNGVLTLRNNQTRNGVFEFDAKFETPGGNNGTAKPSHSASASASTTASASASAEVPNEDMLLTNLADARFRVKVRPVSSQNSSDIDALLIDADDAKSFNMLGSGDDIEFLVARSASIDDDTFNKTISQVHGGNSTNNGDSSDEIVKTNNTCSS